MFASDTLLSLLMEDFLMPSLQPRATGGRDYWQQQAARLWGKAEEYKFFSRNYQLYSELAVKAEEMSEGNREGHPYHG